MAGQRTRIFGSAGGLNSSAAREPGCGSYPSNSVGGSLSGEVLGRGQADGVTVWYNWPPRCSN